MDNERKIRSTDDVVLSIRDLTKVYPGTGTIALCKVNLDIRRGEVHGIIGKNGAGKTTLVGIVAGIIAPTEGSIFLGDKEFKALSRERARIEGLSIVPQEPDIIHELTVGENLFSPDFLGCTRGGMFVNWTNLYSRGKQVIDATRLNINVRAKANDLSISEQQLLLVVKAFYVEDAQIIILDEVAASLTQEDEGLLYEIIDEQKKRGKAILFISHRMGQIFRVCDRITVLRDGRMIATDECRALDEEKLSSLIVGEDNGKSYKLRKMEDSPIATKQKTDEVVLRVENLKREGAFHGITFELRRGEIVGLAGLRGSGRTEIFKAIAGIDPAHEGVIQVVNGRKRFTSPSEAFRHGIVYLPEDRENEGVFNTLSVMENLTLLSLRRLVASVLDGVFINKDRERGLATTLTRMLDILTVSLDHEIRYLSGGNKQKVIVGRILATKPRVFLLDEPTRGIDISAKRSMLALIKERLSEFAGVLITAPAEEDLISICDRILVLHEGEIVSEFSREEFDEVALYQAMQGLRVKRITHLDSA